MGVLEFIQEEGLVEQAREKGIVLNQGLKALSLVCPFLGEPRGFGLMQGLPVLTQDNISAADRTDLILEKMKDRGYLIGKNGLDRDTLAFQPPLVIRSSEIEGMLKTLKSVVMEMM